ncbi:MAG TPA: hypothetical protein VLY23_15430 [Candidatus Acidoferrum sp.]|nr:hypothetical protein [Candidatus Acidoferrum sp.]
MTLGKLGKFCLLGLMLSLLGAATAVRADSARNAWVVTSTNAAKNQLLVYNFSGKLVQTLSTQGQGGASGNSGGIDADRGLVAVVNFGSKTVAIFERWDDGGLHFKQLVPAASSPLSVAFGHDHLYILGATTVESHRLFGSDTSVGADGVVTLLKADGSAAQVGVLPNQLIITEKSNTIETVNLLPNGAVSGFPTRVANIPSNVNAPFGLITRGNDAYVTIAHANEITLVRNGTVLTVTGSGTQNAPCWLALVGPFLYSSNSPSMSVSRYAVYGQKIVQDAAVAASFNGAPTDIASGEGLVAVIDGSGMLSHLSIFSIDEDGNLTLRSVNTIGGAANGVAVVRGDRD